MTKDKARTNALAAVARHPSRIGIDASRAISSAPTGTEYYSRALINSLLGTDSGLYFLLYTRAEPPPGLFPQTNNYRIYARPFPRLWTHARLSYEMLTRPPDALFVPAHVLPLYHPRRSVVTVHDLGFNYFPEAHPLFSRVYLDLSTRWNAAAAQVVIADSAATRDDLVRFYGIARSKIRVVYPGFDSAIFKPIRANEHIARVRDKYQLGTRYILSVGTRHPRKNYARLVEASARLPEEYELVIAGKAGWKQDSIADAITRCGMERRVKLLDYVPSQDMPALYGGAALAVIPSLYEGFGFPVLEAQACETPLACSNTSSLPEVAGDGALYFDPLDVNQMAATMRRVLSDAGLRAELVARGRENAKRFRWEHAAREIVEIVSGL